MVCSQALVCVGQPYSMSFGMQSSQTPATKKSVRSHARTPTEAAKSVTVMRGALGLTGLRLHGDQASAMGGKRTREECLNGGLFGIAKR